MITEHKSTRCARKGCACSVVDRFCSILQNSEEKRQTPPIIPAILTPATSARELPRTCSKGGKKCDKEAEEEKTIVYQCLWNDIAQWSEQPLRANLFSSSLSRGERVQYACPQRQSHSTDLIYTLHLCLSLPGTQKEKKIMEKMFFFPDQGYYQRFKLEQCHRWHKRWRANLRNRLSCCRSFSFYVTAFAGALTFHGSWSA